MKNLLLILIFIAGLVLSSCESQEHILVTVVDKDNGLALDSVQVQVKAGKNGTYDKNYDEGYTDENGKYETHMMIGCSFGCYDIQTTYTKSGYDKIVQLNNLRDTIELVKSIN